MIDHLEGANLQLAQDAVKTCYVPSTQESQVAGTSLFKVAQSKNNQKAVKVQLGHRSRSKGQPGDHGKQWPELER